MAATLYNADALPPKVPQTTEPSRLGRALSRLQETRIKIRDTQRGAPWTKKQKSE